ncbi:hypothetical protein [Microbispora bryophytorum]|uniref:hypothetical protein n=1 Tax=Microbispora bryophytorum TaxID=1460882 RepID=UPI0033D5D5E1
MGAERHAYLFKPGTYGTGEHPLQIKVGYYTEIAGLGASPADVVIHGKVEVYNRCLENDGTGNCLALVNFWRTLSNLSIDIDAADQDGCRQTTPGCGAPTTASRASPTRSAGTPTSAATASSSTATT